VGDFLFRGILLSVKTLTLTQEGKIPVKKLPLPKEEQVRIMNAVNQAIADGKTVMDGCFRIFGATFHKEYLNFLYPIEVIEDYFTAQCRLPKMKPCKAFLSDGVVIRAFLPTSTDVEIIYIVKSPSPSSVAASQDLSDPSP